MVRFSAYALTSTALVGAIAYQAFQQRRQFYPTVRRTRRPSQVSLAVHCAHDDPTSAATARAHSQVIYLTTSKVSVLALGNEALVLTLLVGHIFKKLFFGRLREAEVEHLYERSWYAITETCLAMTIFREEFNVRFVALFTALLFVKIFHWLMQDRISYMEQTPAVPIATHGRMLFLMALLFALDTSFLYHAVSVSLKRGPSVLLLFAFEYLILASTVCATFSKYALHVNDLRLQVIAPLPPSLGVPLHVPFGRSFPLSPPLPFPLRPAAAGAVGRQGRLPLLPRARDRLIPHARVPRLLRADLHVLRAAAAHHARSLPDVPQHGQSGRLGEAVAGHHGLVGLHLKALGCPLHS